MKLKLKKDIQELNNLSFEEREEFENMYDLFEIEIPKSQMYIEIDKSMVDILFYHIIDINLEISYLSDYNYDSGYICEYLYEYFQEQHDPINFQKWRFYNEELDLKYLNLEKYDFISLVILNFLINKDTNIYENFGCTNITNFLLQLLKILHNENLHNFLNFDEITFLR